MDTCIYLLDKSKLKISFRRDPVLVSRVMSALVCLSRRSALPLHLSLLLLPCSSFPGALNTISGCTFGKPQGKSQRHFGWRQEASEIHHLPISKACSCPNDCPSSAATLAGPTQGLCFGGQLFSVVGPFLEPWGLRYKMPSAFWLPQPVVPPSSRYPGGGFPTRGAPRQHQQPR